MIYHQDHTKHPSASIELHHRVKKNRRTDDAFYCFYGLPAVSNLDTSTEMPLPYTLHLAGR